MMASRTALLMVFAAGLVACGCGSKSNGSPVTSSDGSMLYSCAADPRAPAEVVGMMRTSLGGGYIATLMASTPDPPVQGSDSWTVQITDSTGAPVDGLAMNVSPFMPDHGHGTSIVAVVTDTGSGVYGMTPLYLYMEGYWEITLHLQPASGAADSVVLPVCIP